MFYVNKVSNEYTVGWKKLSFKDELKKERARLGWSQQKLSDNFQISKRNIENWESEENTPPQWVCSLLLEKLKSIKKED